MSIFIGFSYDEAEKGGMGGHGLFGRAVCQEIRLYEHAAPGDRLRA